MRKLAIPLDTAIGGFLSLVGVAAGIVGLVIGLRGDSHASIWFLGALIVGICSGAVLLDELASRITSASERIDAVVGSVLLLAAIGFGVVGFVLGLLVRPHALTWLVGGVVLAIVAMTAMADALRRARTSRTGAATVYADLLALIGFVLGAIGFVTGLLDVSRSDIWYWAAIIAGVLATTAQFAIEHYAVAAGHTASVAVS